MPTATPHAPRHAFAPTQHITPLPLTFNKTGTRCSNSPSMAFPRDMSISCTAIMAVLAVNDRKESTAGTWGDTQGMSL